MIRHAKNAVDRLRKSALARDSGWMFLGFGLRVVVQAGYFVLIARALGPHEYGGFVGATALIAIVAPFVSIGAGNLLIKNVSRDKGLFSEYWGNALVMLTLSGIVLLLGVLSLARFVLPSSIPWMLVLSVSISDLMVVRVTDIVGQAFLAMGKAKYTARISLLPYVLRLISAAIVLFVWHRATALCWGWFYLGSTVVSCAVAVQLSNKLLGPPKIALWRIRGELAEGMYYGTGLSAQTIYNDIDKTMLARLSTLDATGIYAAAYRLIDVAFTPVRSVLYAAYPSFFLHGKGGIAASYAYAKKLLPKMMGYSTLMFICLFLAAPIVPFVLGGEYSRTVEALRWLALLPLLKTVHYFLADSLTGAGYQGLRTSAQIFVAILNVGLNFWLIPAYSWRGAAWASLASDGTLVLAMYAAVMFIMMKEARVAMEFSDGRERA
jgi:O-antigen/teichoic acid export membrane protein